MAHEHPLSEYFLRLGEFEPTARTGDKFAPLMMTILMDSSSPLAALAEAEFARQSDLSWWSTSNFREQKSGHEQHEQQEPDSFELSAASFELCGRLCERGSGCQQAHLPEDVELEDEDDRELEVEEQTEDVLPIAWLKCL